MRVPTVNKQMINIEEHIAELSNAIKNSSCGSAKHLVETFKGIPEDNPTK